VQADQTMIVVQLKGGLGNQMFQYACGRAIAYRNNVPLKLDVSAFRWDTLRTYRLSHFNIVEHFAIQEDMRRFFPRHRQVIAWTCGKVRNRWLPYHRRPIVPERQFHFDPEILKVKDDAYLSGYWQCEKYFADVAELIRSEFTFKTEPDEGYKRLLEEMMETNSVSVHIRRGDYVVKPDHGVLGPDYYAGALNFVAQRVAQPRIFVFSDDIAWAKGNLTFPFPAVFIEHNGAERDHEDLRLMRHCKHHVVANSTFSWWGAWLAEWPGQVVVAPKTWFQDPGRSADDVVPERWTKL